MEKFVTFVTTLQRINILIYRQLVLLLHCCKGNQKFPRIFIGTLTPNLGHTIVFLSLSFDSFYGSVLLAVAARGEDGDETVFFVGDADLGIGHAGVVD